MENVENENLDSQETEEIIEEEETEATESTEEAATEESNSSQDDAETEAKKQRAQNQIDRLKRENQALKEAAKRDGNESVTEEVLERQDRLELKMSGVSDNDDQNEVIEFAKFKGISVSEALSTPAIKATLAASDKKRQADRASQAPKNRTGEGKSNDVDKWVAKYLKDGSLPDSQALTSKVLAKLKETQG